MCIDGRFTSADVEFKRSTIRGGVRLEIICYSISFGFAPQRGQSLGDGVCGNFNESSFVVVLHTLEKSASSPAIGMEPENSVKT